MQSVREVAQGKWPGILKALGFEDKYLKNAHGPCPICGGKDRYRFDDKDGRGTYFCSTCGAGDGVKLVMLFKNLDFRNAAMQIEQAAGFVKSSRYEEKKSDEYLKSRLRRLWVESRPVMHGDEVTEYLEGRGIRLSYIPPSLRCHPELMYYREGDEKAIAEGSFAAMLAIITTPDGAGATIHRTWIKDGKKAPVAKPKKIAQGLPIKGGAIRLSPESEVLGVAEGVETALAATQLFGIPTWACVSANGLESWIPPEVTKRVVIFADNDANFVGQAAAYKLAQRLAMSGLDVQVNIPGSVGEDWCDVLRVS
jgi:putative DNA primase/helicase